jgi:hypothetical protein
MDNFASRSLENFLRSQSAWHALLEIRERLVDRRIADVSFSATGLGVQTHLHLDNKCRYSFHEQELALGTLRAQFPDEFRRTDALHRTPACFPADAPACSRRLNLAVAERLLHLRAEMDGYARDAYPIATDPDDLVAAIVGALRHWCSEHDIDWEHQLGLGEDLHQLELIEELPGPGKHKGDESTNQTAD